MVNFASQVNGQSLAAIKFTINDSQFTVAFILMVNFASQVNSQLFVLVKFTINDSL